MTVASLVASATHSGLFAGGSALMLLGAGLALLRKVPEHLADFISHAFLLKLEIRETEVYESVEGWLDEERASFRAVAASFRYLPGARLSEVPARPRVVLSPGRGTHMLRHQGRWFLINHSTEDGSKNWQPREVLSDAEKRGWSR